MNELTRRRAVAAVATAAVGGVAGCSGVAEEADDEPEGSDDEPTSDAGDGSGADDAESDETAAESGDGGTILGELAVENLHDETHTVDVLVEFGSEIEHWSTHELAPGDAGVDLERDWPDDAGDFRVTIRTDGEEIQQVTAAKWNEPDCLNLLVLIGRDGEVRVTGDTDGGPCEDGDD
ncbi:hypothetical protein [Natrialbaceae archaeon AArc-T1-2]|uniref:hypothetical protein n=1 Tax=Natrialbaceae archaeon AArc-T1-2 TaxID=3053904 RepID=UPI00255ACD2C|nr:hypothetical protein [Natrialbaceae archaeon AArc-T1-2]WIV68310.1 hypothetical protein QQ977_06200 [Natrialbaceae archaeon AArc-T1-2]